MGIDVLPPSNVVNSRHQEFKDVFEVSEEPPEAVTKERSHHFPKGLPSLKQRAVRLKKLMPSKTLYRDDTLFPKVGYYRYSVLDICPGEGTGTDIVGGYELEGD